MLPVLLSAALVGGSDDVLTLLRFDAEKSGMKAGLYVSGSVDAPGAVKVSDVSFFAFGGKQPVRAAFGLDADGDGKDEIAVLREKVAKGRYVLSLHQQPAKMFDSVSAPFRKSKANAIGSHPAFGEIVAADSIDLDGDLDDEVLFVRVTEGGAQRLEVYGAPDKKGAMAGPFASFLDLGTAPADAIVDAVGVDLDADGAEEIALLRRSADGTARIDVLPAPQGIADPFFGAIATAVDAGTPPIVAIEAIDLDGDGVDELLAQRDAKQGTATIEIVAVPLGALGEPLAPMASSLLVHDADDFPVGALLALRGATPKPNLDGDAPLPFLLQGKFTGLFQHSMSTGAYYSQDVSVSIGPITGIDGNFDSAKSTFEISVSGGTAATGKANLAAKSILFGADELPMPDPGSAGATLLLRLESATIDDVTAKAVLTGTYSGSVVTASGQKLPVSNGVFILFGE